MRGQLQYFLVSMDQKYLALAHLLIKLYRSNRPFLLVGSSKREHPFRAVARGTTELEGRSRSSLMRVLAQELHPWMEQAVLLQQSMAKAHSARFRAFLVFELSVRFVDR